MKVISFINHKGGVGKTTLAFNYAHYLGQKNKVLFMDLDPQMAATFLFDNFEDKAFVGRIFREETVTPSAVTKNIDLLNSGAGLRLLEIKSFLHARPARAHLLKKYLAAAADKYDYCVIDTAPQIDMLLDSTIMNSQVCIIPVQSEILPILGLEAINKLIEEIRLAGNNAINYFVAVNMFSKVTNLQKKILAEMKAKYPKIVLENYIRRSIAVVEAQERKTPIFKSKKEVAADFLRMFRELDRKMVI